MKSTRRDNPTEPLLLTATQAMRLLNVQHSTWYGDKIRGRAALVDRLKAQGLKTVQFRASKPGGKPTVRFVASSLRKIIERAAVTETPLE